MHSPSEASLVKLINLEIVRQCGLKTGNELRVLQRGYARDQKLRGDNIASQDHVITTLAPLSGIVERDRQRC